MIDCVRLREISIQNINLLNRLKIETNGAFNQFEQIKMLIINPPFVVMTFFKDRLIHPNYNNQVLERLTT
jgi:hypothetical protein